MSISQGPAPGRCRCRIKRQPVGRTVDAGRPRSRWARPLVPRGRLAPRRRRPRAGLCALFPVVYVVSASLNPLGNVVTSTLIPQTFSLEQLRQAARRLPVPDAGPSTA